MRHTIIVLFALLFSASAAAQNKHRAYPLGTKLSAVSLNAAAASRTFTVGPTLGRDSLLDYGTLVLEYTFTHANNGTISTTCTAGQTVATADKTLTTCVVSGGNCTIQFGGVATTATLTTDKKWLWRLGIKGIKALSCVVAHGGTPAAGDVITVTGYVVTD